MSAADTAPDDYVEDYQNVWPLKEDILRMLNDTAPSIQMKPSVMFLFQMAACQQGAICRVAFGMVLDIVATFSVDEMV